MKKFLLLGLVLSMFSASPAQAGISVADNDDPTTAVDATKAFNEGLSAFQEARFDDALGFMNKAIEHDGKDHEARYIRGSIYMKKKDYEKALEDFKVATENFESNEKNKADQKYYLMGRGYCQHKLGKLDEALATYEEVLQLEDAKGWHIALTNRGNVKLDKEDKEGAMEDFKAALEKKDDYAPALNGRGKVKFLNDDIDGAMEDFEEAIAKDANHAPAYNNRALVKYKRGEYEDALKDADAAVAKGGDDFAEAFLNRGTIQEMLFKADEACNDWTKAKELGEEKAAGYLESSGCATEEK